MGPDSNEVIIRIANTTDGRYAVSIINEMESSAKIRGTGISKRSPEYICQKMGEGNAIIATAKNGEWVGFSYLETWSNGENFGKAAKAA